MSRVRWLGRAAVLGLGLGGAVALSGCAVSLEAACPRCPRLVVGERPPVPLGTRTVFLLVPGLLGYGWEWNGAQIALAQLPATAVVVDEWNPWTSVRTGGMELAGRVQYLLRRLPRSVTRVVVLGHSAGGLLAVAAAPHLQAPAGVAVEVLAVGAPLAGSYFHVLGGQDNFSSPLPLAMAAAFTHWPEPAPGVALAIWPTGASDPVMQVRFGHDPGDRRVLPRAVTLHPLPSELDHNVALSWVARRLVAALRAPPVAESAPARQPNGELPAQPPAGSTSAPQPNGGLPIQSPAPPPAGSTPAPQPNGGLPAQSPAPPVAESASAPQPVAKSASPQAAPQPAHEPSTNQN